MQGRTSDLEIMKLSDLDQLGNISALCLIVRTTALPYRLNGQEFERRSSIQAPFQQSS